MTNYEISRHLQDRGCAFILWQIDDVIDFCDDLYGIPLNKNRAKYILKNLHRNADCSIGITWDSLEAEIFDFLLNNIHSVVVDWIKEVMPNNRGDIPSINNLDNRDLSNSEKTIRDNFAKFIGKYEKS